MILVDTHTHTHHSFDGRESSLNMAKRGQELGLSYLAFTDHFDADYSHISAYQYIRQIDLNSYVNDIEKLKKQFPFLALGIECGFSIDAENDYIKNIPLEKFDYVLNSIHTVNGLDCYNKEYFDKHGSKKAAYEEYLLAVLKSVDAKYFFNTISHIGFVQKNAPYEDISMPLTDYGDIIEAIFKKIIATGASVEVNTNIRSGGFMPEKEILKRYFEMGGRSITFASDAHVAERICDRFKEISVAVKDIGFNYWTVYRDRKPQYIPLL